MAFPIVVIKQIESSVYEWSIYIGQDKHDGSIGATSISTCLAEAAQSIPDLFPLAEVIYQAIHMGTYVVKSLKENAAGIADEIAKRHGVLSSYLG